MTCAMTCDKEGGWGGGGGGRGAVRRAEGRKRGKGIQGAKEGRRNSKQLLVWAIDLHRL